MQTYIVFCFLFFVKYATDQRQRWEVWISTPLRPSCQHSHASAGHPWHTAPARWPRLACKEIRWPPDVRRMVTSHTCGNTSWFTLNCTVKQVNQSPEIKCGQRKTERRKGTGAEGQQKKKPIIWSGPFYPLSSDQRRVLKLFLKSRLAIFTRAENLNSEH